MKAWYLIHSKPRQEYVARENLERQGYSTYLPVTLIRRKKNGRTGSEPGPMFPRYLFISLSETTDDWRPIRSTIGVSSLVRFGHVPAKVPDMLISQLKLREDEMGLYVQPELLYEEGEPVRVAEGPFEGYEGIFQSKNAKNRVSLLISLLEKSIKIDIDQKDIEPVARSGR